MDPQVLACLDRDFVRAADLWAQAGSPTWEARLRIRAAEELMERGLPSEAADQVERASAFYRSLGGTYWIERGEAVLRGASSPQ